MPLGVVFFIPMHLTGKRETDSQPEKCPKCYSSKHTLVPVGKGDKLVLRGMVVRKCSECGAMNADRVRMFDLNRYGKLCWE